MNNSIIFKSILCIGTISVSGYYLNKSIKDEVSKVFIKQYTIADKYVIEDMRSLQKNMNNDIYHLQLNIQSINNKLKNIKN